MRRYETDAIIADPERDGPRLELATMLERSGDPRGEFIRLQCDLEKEGRPRWDPAKILLEYEAASMRFEDKCEADPQLRALAEHEQHLLQQYGGEWCVGYHDRGFGRPSHHFRRGFVEHLNFTPQELIDQASGLFKAYPLTQSLTLSWDDRDLFLGAVTAALGMPIRLLDLSGSVTVHPETMGTLANQTSTSIRILRLPDAQGDDLQQLTDEHLRVLSETGWIRQLERLFLCWDAWTEGFPMVRQREELINALFGRDLCWIDCCT